MSSTRGTRATIGSADLSAAAAGPASAARRLPRWRLRRCSSAPPGACAEDAGAWLARAATAARTLNYVGTIVYQHGGRVETSRLVHFNDAGERVRKARQSRGPAARGDPQPRRGALLLPRCQARARSSRARSATRFRRCRRSSRSRSPSTTICARPRPVASRASTRRPGCSSRRTACATGTSSGPTSRRGLLLKARIVNENNERSIEQFAFTDVAIGGEDRSATWSSRRWPPRRPSWQVREGGAGGGASTRRPAGPWHGLPPGLRRGSSKAIAPCAANAAPVAHLVYSDGLVAVSVFVEPCRRRRSRPGFPAGRRSTSTVRQLDDYLVTVLGEAPGATVRQIAYSVAHR